MMEASDHGYLDDAVLVGVLHESRLRGVLSRERCVRALWQYMR
jgi:hypothetical protein